MIHHFACGHLVEQFLGARDFRLLNWTQFKAFHTAFGFSNKEDVLHGARIECNRPVRRIVAYRRGNLKSPRQLGIDADLIRRIQILGKLSLSMLLSAVPSVNT